MLNKVVRAGASPAPMCVVMSHVIHQWQSDYSCGHACEFLKCVHVQNKTKALRLSAEITRGPAEYTMYIHM